MNHWPGEAMAQSDRRSFGAWLGTLLLTVVAGCGEPTGHDPDGGSSLPTGCHECNLAVLEPDGPCASQQAACEQSPDCSLYISCYQLCGGSACDECAAQYPDGAALFQAIMSCGLSACASCMPDSPGTMYQGCLACHQRADSGACAAAVAACEATPDCAAYNDCVNACDVADTTCLGDCANQHPDGERAAGDRSDCETEQCYDACGF